jgi:hypothetical protein
MMLTVDSIGPLKGTVYREKQIKLIGLIVSTVCAVNAVAITLVVHRLSRQRARVQPCLQLTTSYLLCVQSFKLFCFSLYIRQVHEIDQLTSEGLGRQQVLHQ